MPQLQCSSVHDRGSRYETERAAPNSPLISSNPPAPTLDTLLPEISHMAGAQTLPPPPGGAPRGVPPPAVAAAQPPAQGPGNAGGLAGGQPAGAGQAAGKAPVQAPGQALVPVPRTAEERDPRFGPQVLRLPVEVDVAVPIRGFRVRHLLALEPGQVVESPWNSGNDLPVAARGVTLAWSEFEVVESRLAVRVTRVA
jgi:flagellar motor switch/type III secretory pathway protein FliN